MVNNEFAAIAADSLRTRIAVLDGDGVVRWSNQAWRRAARVPPIAAAPEGSNLLVRARADRSPYSQAVVAGILAVISGATTYVELRSEAGDRSIAVTITPSRGRRGAVIQYAESSAMRSHAATAPAAIDASRIVERLTPRELEVLTRMAGGQSNRAIATDLGIEYTTVRGHVQSLLAKLGARSRFDAVAYAYRSGLVRESDLALDRKALRGPGDEAADDVGRIREAEVV